MQILPSPLMYSRAPHNYVRAKAVPEERFPNVEGSFSIRNFDDDVDELFRVESDHLIPKELHLPYEGFQPANDPALEFEGEHVKLHPIEVVIDKSVLQSMVDHARAVCGVNAGELKFPAREDLKETGGILAGELRHDAHQRVWVHVTHSFHSEPEVVGTQDNVTFGLDAQGPWLTRIHHLGLVDLGFWHSHPTYNPFQSDARFGWGADVQSTVKTCRAWWKSAFVIDPFPIPTKNGIDAVELGCYKPVKAGGPIDMVNGEEGWRMGWRSASILVPGGAVGD